MTGTAPETVSGPCDDEGARWRDPVEWAAAWNCESIEELASRLARLEHRAVAIFDNLLVWRWEVAEVTDPHVAEDVRRAMTMLVDPFGTATDLCRQVTRNVDRDRKVRRPRGAGSGVRTSR